MSREWQPGDVAMVLCSDGEYRQATCELRHLYLSNDPPESWPVWRFPDGMSRRCDESDARPLIVVDPEQTDLYIQSDGRDMTVWHDLGSGDSDALLTEKEAGPVLWAHLKATLPTRDEPQDEPTDPGVRVRDVDQCVWARIEDRWQAIGSQSFSWTDLALEFGPLTIIEPDVPSADERPFKVGDKVIKSTVSHTIYGTSNDFDLGEREADKGTTGEVIACPWRTINENYVRVAWDGSGRTSCIAPEHLKHQDPA